VNVPGWSARELEVISGLRELGAAATPDAAARERIRSGILERFSEPERRAPSRRRRVLANVLAAAVVVLVALGGIGLLLSKDALPGHPLYDIKRAGESAELGLAFGDSATAEKYLKFAATRLDELAALGPADPAAYISTLIDFQREAATGTAQFIMLAVQNGQRQLEQLVSWAREQQGKLAAAQPAIPAAARPQFTSSAELVTRIENRAQALTGRLDCFRITSGEADDLGALPDTSPCRPPAETFAGGPRLVPPPTTLAPESASSPPVSTSARPSDPAPSHRTSQSPPSSGTAAPPAAGPTTVAPRSARSTTTTSPQPPVSSLPPLLPGLPGVGIG
jgi:uncharacterized protein DUF5667